MSGFELPVWSATRRNHALEHATINVLSEQRPGLRLVGRSDWTGFTLYGPLATEDLKAALDSALRRLRAGEHELAIHPRCGTNLATGFVLAGLASSAALSGRRRSPLEKMVQLVVGLGAAFALAKPLGCQLQERVTTSASVGDLRVVKVLRLERGTVVVHRVDTAQG